MGCRILHDRDNAIAALYCSTSDVAFGPVFYDGDIWDAAEQAAAFCRWLPDDPRRYDAADLERKYTEWKGQEQQQYDREHPPTCQACGETVGTCDDDCPTKAAR